MADESTGNDGCGMLLTFVLLILFVMGIWESLNKLDSRVKVLEQKAGIVTEPK